MLLSDMLDGVDGEPMGLGAAGGLGGDEDEKDDDEDDEDDEIAADAAEDELMKSDVNVRAWGPLQCPSGRRGLTRCPFPARPTCVPC